MYDFIKKMSTIINWDRRTNQQGWNNTSFSSCHRTIFLLIFMGNKKVQ